MTKAERERAIAEAMEFLTEDPDRFPGWAVDEKLDSVLFRCILEIHPRANLRAGLASMRVHWVVKSPGPAKSKQWRARTRNWFGPRKGWDPLIGGIEGRDPRATIQGPPARRTKSPEAKEGELTADQIRTWHDHPWAR